MDHLDCSPLKHPSTIEYKALHLGIIQNCLFKSYLKLECYLSTTAYNWCLGQLLLEDFKKLRTNGAPVDRPHRKSMQ